MPSFVTDGGSKGRMMIRKARFFWMDRKLRENKSPRDVSSFLTSYIYVYVKVLLCLKTYNNKYSDFEKLGDKNLHMRAIYREKVTGITHILFYPLSFSFLFF